MTTPFPYQDTAVNITEERNGRVLLALAMGLGKSLCSYLYASRKPEERLPLLVICPASVKWQWQDEALKHFGWPSEVLEGTRPPKRKVPGRFPVTIVNYDILRPWRRYLKRLNPKTVVVDESVYIANRTAKRTYAVWSIARLAPHVLCLSGQPLVNRPADLWPTLHLLDPEAFPGFQAFGHAYCGARLEPWGVWSFKGATDTKGLHQLLKPYMIRMKKEDVIDQLPPKRRIVVPLPMSRPDEYFEARNEFLTWLARRFSKGRVRRASKAEAVVKLGYLKRLAARLKRPAVYGWVDDFLEQSPGKLLLFAWHTRMIERLDERYHKVCTKVDGSVTGQQRELAKQKFQLRRDCRIFIGQIKAAGMGLNLTAAHTAAFAELPWAPSDLVQAEDRGYARVNDMHGLDSYLLVAKDSVEVKLLQILQRKQKVISAVLDGNGQATGLDVYDQLCEALLEEANANP